MTALESAISALLVEMEPLLQPEFENVQKWIALSDHEMAFDESRRPSIGTSYVRASPRIRSLPTFAQAQDEWSRDRFFSAFSHLAGRWGTLDGVLPTLLQRSARFGKRRVRIDVAAAVAHLQAIAAMFKQPTVSFQATARVAGVHLLRRRVQLRGGVELVRLTIRERNARQRHVIPYMPQSIAEQQLPLLATEVRKAVVVPVDRSTRHAYFDARRQAHDVAQEVFSRVLSAIMIAAPGDFRLLEFKLVGGVEGIAGGVSLEGRWPPHGHYELGLRQKKRLDTAYELLSGGSLSDRALATSVHRFLLARQRVEQIDRLVDLVISWEGLLLTQSNNPSEQELGYRFSINGASLLARASSVPRLQAFRKMRSAYSARSSVVHGGTEKRLNDALKGGEFSSVSEVCEFLEARYRDALYWLARRKASGRPYVAELGWEKLLWSTAKSG